MGDAFALACARVAARPCSRAASVHAARTPLIASCGASDHGRGLEKRTWHGVQRPRQDRVGEPRRIMGEAFPTTPRAPTVVRLSAIVIGVVGAGAGHAMTITSTPGSGSIPGLHGPRQPRRRVDRPGAWNGRGDLYQSRWSRWTAIRSPPRLRCTRRRGAASGYAHPLSPAIPARRGARGHGPQPALRALRLGVSLRRLPDEQRRLSRRGPWCGCFARARRSGSHCSRSAPRGALWMLTAKDLYGPADFFRLHVAARRSCRRPCIWRCSSRARIARPLRVGGYVLSLALLVPYQSCSTGPARTS